MNILKKSISVLLAGIIVVLAIVTIMEKADASAAQAYTSPWFVALWAALAVASLVYVVRRRLYRRLPTFMLHMSLLLILLGAAVSWCTSEHGQMRLREGEKSSEFTLEDGTKAKMPFTISLTQFEVVNYAGTDAPMDFISHLQIDGTQGVVSMNNVLSYHGYRFYQSGYDGDGGGSVFSIAHDTAGIAVTYTGYALLLLSIIWFMAAKGTRFRLLLKKLAGKPATLIVAAILGMSCQQASATDLPALPKDVAADMGDLYVLYGDRICPLQTMAKEFTEKLCGSASYDGLTAEQVLTGWLYYPTDWSKEPMIKIKSARVRELLGIDGKYASVRDFFTVENVYKLEQPLREIDKFADPMGLREAAEKFDLINRLTAGTSLKIFPAKSPDGVIGWYSQGDHAIPVETNNPEWMFIKMSLSYANELVQTQRWDDLQAFYAKVKKYQQKNGGQTLPSDARFNAEKTYNACSNARPFAITMMCVGLVAFFYFCIATAKGRKPKRWVKAALWTLMALGWVYLSTIIALLWIVSQHVPMSNGYETMLFMAWCVAPLSLIAQRRMPMALQMGALLCGLTTMVAMMGISNPRVSQLMPVLHSPLLSVHVAVIMLAYVMLAFMALNGIAAIVIRLHNKQSDDIVASLKEQSELLLYPATFLLTIGIFLGAIWANVSWGRYWGWDPKEVWALITMLIYAIAFHSESLPWLRRPMRFHVYMVVAFFSVLFTYFGVNFILSGMHSYA